MVITKTWWYNKYIYFESNNREKNPPMNKQTPPPTNTKQTKNAKNPRYTE